MEGVDRLVKSRFETSFYYWWYWFVEEASSIGFQEKLTNNRNCIRQLSMHAHKRHKDGDDIYGHIDGRKDCEIPLISSEKDLLELINGFKEKQVDIKEKSGYIIALYQVLYGSKTPAILYNETGIKTKICSCKICVNVNEIFIINNKEIENINKNLIYPACIIQLLDEAKKECEKNDTLGTITWTNLYDGVINNKLYNQEYGVFGHDDYKLEIMPMIYETDNINFNKKLLEGMVLIRQMAFDDERIIATTPRNKFHKTFEENSIEVKVWNAYKACTIWQAITRHILIDFNMTKTYPINGIFNNFNFVGYTNIHSFNTTDIIRICYSIMTDKTNVSSVNGGLDILEVKVICINLVFV